MRFNIRILLTCVTALMAFLALSAPTPASGQQTHHHDHHSGQGHGHQAPDSARLLVSGLDGGLGSTVGPDGALYVVEGVAGRVTRVDPSSGATSIFADGLPQRLGDVGGAMDVAFVGHEAYVLVTLVGPDVGGSSVVGVYHVDGPHDVSVVADIGTWAIAHPPVPAFFVPSGVQFAMLPYKGDLLVTDGHHNRVLRIDLQGDPADNISEVIAFDDIVPTGLARKGHNIYLAEAGPVPHLPENGRVVRFSTQSATAKEVASGAPLLVDVEFARGHRLYALSQGTFTPGNPEGSPANPHTGSLVRVRRDGTMTPVLHALDRPTSLEIIGHTAYIVTLTGEIWKVGLRHSGH